MAINALCRECHGNQMVTVMCACGCGNSKEIDCRHCNSTGVEPTDHSRTILNAVLPWFQEKLTVMKPWLHEQLNKRLNKCK